MTASLKCNGYGLESLLAHHLDKGSVYTGRGAYVNVLGSVHWEGVYGVGECTLGTQIFFN